MTFFGKLCTSGAVGLAALLVSQASAGSVVCLGDLNGDNQVDAADLAILLGAWGTPNADLTGDGDTNGADLAVLLGAWGPCPGGNPACPNPEHNCFVAGTPGCSDEDCCNAVCTVDPFCCDTQWDGICVGGAVNLCGSESCGASAGNDCCTEAPTPGCNDEICCNIVCTVDPFCCNNQWDGLCVSGAEKLCGLDCGDEPACGVPGTGDCCEANGTPFCDDAECCNLVCAADPFCCTTAWDGICAGAAVANCGVCAPDPACGVPGTGNCCEANGTPFCDDAECCNLVCAADPFCCENQWDGICADAAIEQCGVCGGGVACGTPGTGNCCEANGTPFCDDAECCNLICAADPFCCENQWDGICADAAIEQCGVCGGGVACGTPGTGNCCEANGTPFCDDAECCNLICAADPFCCATAWDGICADAAIANCGVCTPDPACGVPGTGNCCEANGTPFCDDAECCNLICAADPFCCNNQWDGICADAAIEQCGVCNPPVCPNPEHGCFTVGSAGCSDETCCNAVCAADPFCCNISWDGACVNGANKLCGNAACPNPEHDCFTQGTPGCSDQTCCNAVCAADPFCCDTQWDGICVNGAQALCQ